MLFFFNIPAVMIMRLMQFVVTRRRELRADAAAQQLIGDAHGLATALSILATENVPMRRVNRAVAHLFIISPLGQSRPWHDIHTILRSHPSVQERINRLLGDRKP